MKQCVICGEDCSGKPRTKDRQGRYYCQACHDAALAKKEAGGGVAAGSASASDAMALDAPPGEGDGYDIMGSILDAAPTAGAAPPPPPGAGGFASQDDRMMGLEAAPPRAPSTPAPMTMYGAGRSEPASTGRGWSLTIGILALVWGSFEGLLLVLQIAAGSDSSGNAARQVGSMVGTGIAAIMTISLLLGGVGCLTRRPGAVGQLKFWAWGRIFVLAIVGMVLIGAGLKTGMGSNEAEAGIILGTVIVGLLLFASPSILCLFLVSRRGFKNEVASWR